MDLPIAKATTCEFDSQRRRRLSSSPPHPVRFRDPPSPTFRADREADLSSRGYKSVELELHSPIRPWAWRWGLYEHRGNNILTIRTIRFPVCHPFLKVFPEQTRVSHTVRPSVAPIHHNRQLHSGHVFFTSRYYAACADPFQFF